MDERRIDLEARILQLERENTSVIGALDAITNARGIKGVRVIGEWDQEKFSVTVMGDGIGEENATKVAALFANTMFWARAVMVAGVEKLVPDEGEPVADGGEGAE